MAAKRGIAFQEKVSRLLSKQSGKPVLKANRSLSLRDTVADRKQRKGEATCVTEMSALMVCWKQQNFAEEPCSYEMKSFFTCVEEAKAMKNKTESTKAERLPPKVAKTLLKRYPNLHTEI
ncbi:coiled-coil-helix-coiled-coil-helix domain-containing protein 1 [Dicentrarchus labrax]|uniref:Coiled-coil-helix-coiled-coil-helix domain containing 1 n=1 Tax=Dicentrarchus labrax TaxID=13489 RepID=A0A8C4IJG2_DICLA|nr:coiled-coil-helix-coiled-coil-helix domain-containing protein 1 [Dicentrarchus labrax]